MPPPLQAEQINNFGISNFLFESSDRPRHPYS